LLKPLHPVTPPTPVVEARTLFTISPEIVAFLVLFTFHMQAKKIITRWTSIRDRFRRELNDEAEQSRSGAGTSQKRKSPFFEMLGFLRTVMDLRSTSTNISETEEEEGDSDSGNVIQATENVPEEITAQHGAEQPVSSEPSPHSAASRTTAQERQERQRVPVRIPCKMTHFKMF
ncbi:hypothetical protein AB205_0181810, partial [Aquarana catesbeiana]